MPTRLLKLRSKKTVAAPFARASAGLTVPDVNASVSPGFCGSGASWPAKSTQSGFASGIPHSRANALPGATSARATAMQDGAAHALVVAATAAGRRRGLKLAGDRTERPNEQRARSQRRAAAPARAPGWSASAALGLVAKGVLYAVVGILAVKVALGGREESPDK